MANGLVIAGTGLVTWSFQIITGVDLPVKTMAYYVPGAKVRLLSPQRVFDLDSGKGGRYFGDHEGFKLIIQNHTIAIPYNKQNSLPIGYALIQDSSKQVLQDDNNQNLTGGQKILIHWHHRFGHLNLLSVQQILRAPPFLMPKFATASKCERLGLKCSIFDYAKGHRRSTKLSLNSKQVSDLNSTIGALKVTHLNPGAQVSVNHFESRVLGRTFDSFSEVNSNTYKGGCIFVDHSSGYIFVEHQLGFSAIETIRAKKAFERFALSVGVYTESYLTDSGI
jgi:hypothetical protein